MLMSVETFVETPNRKRLVLLLSCWVLVIATGCQRDYVRPGDLVEIHGKVYLDGHPVNEARVVFVPENVTLTSQFLISHGVTNSKGVFELTTTDNQEGALVGKHRVFISRANFEAEEFLPDDSFKLGDEKMGVETEKQDVNEIWSILDQTIQQHEGELIPFYYNCHSDLKFEVIPGMGIQDVRFDLSSIDPMLLN